MTRVTHPSRSFDGRVAGVDFAGGAAETTNPGALAYFRRKGYTLTDTESGPSPVPASRFDPGAYTVGDVVDYLVGVDEEERQRVFKAERGGKARKGILEGE